MSTSLVCLLAACCWPSNDKDVTDAIKQCMDDDDQTAHTAMRTLAAQAEDGTVAPQAPPTTYQHRHHGPCNSTAPQIPRTRWR
jgi:peptide methionine sulfoxide reductase MsrB